VIDAFIDTNVLLYAASVAPAEAAKARIARDLLQNVSFGISIQVLQEFYVNASRKLQANIPAENLDRIIRALKRQPIAPITLDIFVAAIALSARFQISYWDAAIIAAAKTLGARTVYSEDLSHDQIYDGITIVNPFLPKPGSR
jgi:predicted nucleic acid-binding protein